jgi:hypothetical protein
MTSQGKRNITADPRTRASGISRVSRKASPRKTPVTEGGYRRPNRGLLASLPQGAAKNCDGGLGQIKPGSSVCVHCGFHRRPVGVGEASLCIGMPLVLGASKCRRGDRPGEKSIGVCVRIVECDANLVAIPLVPVHHQQRPLAVRPQRGIGESNLSWQTDESFVDIFGALLAGRLRGRLPEFGWKCSLLFPLPADGSVLLRVV